MSNRQERMRNAFRNYEAQRARILVDHSIVSIPVGSRLRRIVRQPDGWWIWMATDDFIHGTYLDVRNDGRIIRVTVRPDEGPEYMSIRPSDEYIATQASGQALHGTSLHKGSSD